MKVKKLDRRTTVVLLSLLSLISLLGAAAMLTQALYQNRALPHTTVAGLKIGGQNQRAVYQLLNQQAQTLSQTPLTLHLNNQPVSVTPQELGISLSPDLTSQEIFTTQPNWHQWRFWQQLWQPKTFSLSYGLDDAQLRQVVEQKFGLNKAAHDAQLTVKDGQLVVSPSQAGITIDSNELKNNLNFFLGTAHAQDITINYAEASPTVTTEQATTVKGQIEAALHPLKLQSANRQFLLSVSDQYNLIDFAVKDSQLSWQISQDKLRDYLQSKVAAKVNVKMIEKVVQNGNNAVLTEGKDGQSADIASVLPTIYQTITDQNPNTDPITIPIKTISFTEKHVDPHYVSNLFPGLYVDVNLSTQEMFIVNGENVSQHFVISSGQRSLPTPTGLFYIKNKIEIARSPLYRNLWMPKWNALAKNPDGSGYDGYGVHDLPCFDKECHLVEGASHLGRPVSHGCVRLGHDNAAWFYDNIPVGTPVNIHR